MHNCGGTELAGDPVKDHASLLTLVELTLTSLHIASRLLQENDIVDRKIDKISTQNQIFTDKNF